MAERKVVIYTKAESRSDRESADNFLVKKDFSLMDRTLSSVSSKVNFKELSFRQKEQLLLSIPTPWAKTFLYGKFLENIEKPESEKFFLHDLISNEISGILYTIALHPEKLKVEKVHPENEEIFKDPQFKRLFGNVENIEILLFEEIPIAISNKELFLIPKIIYSPDERKEINPDLGNELFKDHFLNPINELDEKKSKEFYKFISLLINLREILDYGDNFYRFLEKLIKQLGEKLPERVKEDEITKIIENIKKDEEKLKDYPLETIIKFWRGLKHEEISDYLAKKVFGIDNYKVIILPNQKKENKSRIIYQGYSYTKTDYEKLKRNKSDIEREKNVKFISVEDYFSPKLIRIDSEYLLPILYRKLIDDVQDKDVIDKILKGMKVENDTIRTNYEEYEELIFEKSYIEVNKLESNKLIVMLYPWVKGLDEYYLFVYVSDDVSRNLINEIEVYPKDIINGSHTLEIKDDNDIKGRIWVYKLGNLPIFIGFNGRDTESVYYVNKDSVKDVSPTKSDVIYFAVDIGTTNTIIKYKEEDKIGIFDFGIKDELLKVLIPSNISKDLEKKLAKVFLLDKTFNVYKDIFGNSDKGFFRTLLYVFDYKKEEPFLSSHIYLGEEEKESGRIQSNIKWNKKEELKKYIEQLAYFIDVYRKFKNSKEIKIIYSYPTSMEKEDIDSIYNDWKSALEGKIKDKDLKEVLKSFPESVAIFYSRDRRGADLGCAIDIGGGSTDFCVWSRGEIKGHISIKYAGEDIIIRNIREFSSLSKEEIRNYLDKGKFLTDIIKDEEMKQKARMLIALSYINLFATIGSYLRYLQSKLEEVNKNFYVGLLGNGSRTLRFVFNGRERSVIERIFGSFLDSPSFVIDFSYFPKHEVADGLLNMTNSNQKIDNDIKQEIDFFNDINKEEAEDRLKYYFNTVKQTFNSYFEEKINIEFQDVWIEFRTSDDAQYLLMDNGDIGKELKKKGKPITLSFGEKIREMFSKALKGG